MKTAVITGVSRGIGQAIAEAFLADGWHVIGSSTSGAADWQHPELEVLPLALQEAASVDAFASQIRNGKYQLNALINCAGVNYGPDEEPLSIDKLRATIDINLIGPIILTEQLAKNMASNGIIVNISSTAGLLRPIPAHITPYRISKAGINIYTQVLAERLRADTVTVVAYNPGWVRTEMGAPSAPKLPAQVGDEVLSLVNNPPESGTFWDETTLVPWQ